MERETKTYSIEDVEAAVLEARTPQGRKFDVFLNGIASVEAARSLLLAAGFGPSVGGVFRGPGVSAQILVGGCNRRRGDITIFADDEPVYLAAGPGGYLHPSDRPTVD